MSPVSSAALSSTGELLRDAACEDSPEALTHIYDDKVNMAVWQRTLPDQLVSSASGFAMQNTGFAFAMNVGVSRLDAVVRQAFGGGEMEQVAQDVARVSDMFACLFDLERIGVRIEVLTRAMCPRFHVDHVPCRLVTTYTGVATEWLPHAEVNRTLLGCSGNGKSDLEVGLYKDAGQVKQLEKGHVAIMKGEKWIGNENAGLVHRSPSVPVGEPRLVVTLDVVS